MGCAQSKTKKIKIDNKEGGGKIQDEARSYRSKVGAGKLVLKNEAVRVAFRRFIEKEAEDGGGRSEFVTYFETLEQLKPLSRDEQISKLKRLLELTLAPPDSNEEKTNNRTQINSTLFASLRPLRPLKLDKATTPEITKAINSTQDLLIAAVTPEFEQFMNSDEFAELKKTNLENHKSMAPKQNPAAVNNNKAPANKKSTTISLPRMESEFLGVGMQQN